jgi:hypothetical protein
LARSSAEPITPVATSVQSASAAKAHSHLDTCQPQPQPSQEEIIVMIQQSPARHPILTAERITIEQR